MEQKKWIQIYENVEWFNLTGIQNRKRSHLNQLIKTLNVHILMFNYNKHAHSVSKILNLLILAY